MKKWEVKAIPIVHSLDEAASHLEDTLNNMEERNYQPSLFESKERGGYLVVGRLREDPSTLLGERLRAVVAPLEHLKEMLGGEVKFFADCMAQVSDPSFEAAEKELPEIVRKTSRGMSAENLSQLANDIDEMAKHHTHGSEGPCELGKLAQIVVATLRDNAALNLQ